MQIVYHRTQNYLHLPKISGPKLSLKDPSDTASSISLVGSLTTSKRHHLGNFSSLCAMPSTAGRVCTAVTLTDELADEDGWRERSMAPNDGLGTAMKDVLSTEESCLSDFGTMVGAGTVRRMKRV